MLSAVGQTDPPVGSATWRLLTRPQLPRPPETPSLMLSAARHSLSSTSPLYRVSVRRNVVKLNRKYHAKVSGRRFMASSRVLARDADPLHMKPSSSVCPLQG